MSGRSNLIAILGLAQEAGRRLAARLAQRLARPIPSRPVARQGAPAILPGLDTRPAPMRPVRPPAAVNDNPLAALAVEVERDLRARGYLR